MFGPRGAELWELQGSSLCQDLQEFPGKQLFAAPPWQGLVESYPTVSACTGASVWLDPAPSSHTIDKGPCEPQCFAVSQPSPSKQGVPVGIPGIPGRQ